MINSASVTGKSKQTFPLLLLLFLCVGVVAADDCTPIGHLTEAIVSYVHDGDTIWLENGDKVRLIGLNTPEIAARDRPGEPLGISARNMLRRQLTGKRVYLESDSREHDRYERRLAHLFSPDRSNLAAGLIAAGYGYAITIPPNLKHHECYQAAEQRARQKKAGIWQHKYFAPFKAEDVRRTGFMRVRGCVQEIHHARQSVLLRLADKFVLKMSNDDIQSYLRRLLHSIKNASAPVCLYARGWVYNNRRFQERVLQVRHPNAIEFIHQK